MKTKKVKEKESKPILVLVQVRDSITRTHFSFPPTQAGLKRAERYRGLAGVEIVKIYEKGGKKYESN